MFTLSSALWVMAAAAAEAPLAGVCGVTFARRCSLLFVQLRAQSWHEAHTELQQGRKRQMLTRQTNQPGDQQHQQSTKPPAITPRRMYRTSNVRESGESGKKMDKDVRQSSAYNIHTTIPSVIEYIYCCWH